jgi:hypothetical protein
LERGCGSRVVPKKSPGLEGWKSAKQKQSTEHVGRRTLVQHAAKPAAHTISTITKSGLAIYFLFLVWVAQLLRRRALAAQTRFESYHGEITEVLGSNFHTQKTVLSLV